MTSVQEQIAESLINAMKESNGSINWKNFMSKNSIDGTEMSLVIKALREINVIENFIADTTIIRLTEKNGWLFPGFEAQRHIERTEKDTKQKIDRLTIRQLKGDIFQ